MQIPIYQIDAFTDQPYKGNPTIICLLQNDDDLSDELKQKIAAEFNQPFTAFVSRRWTGSTDNNTNDLNANHYKIRYYTTTQEFRLCGHATLATTFILKSVLKDKTIEDTKSGNEEKVFYYETRFGAKLSAKISDKELITLSMPINETDSIVPLDDKWAQNVIRLTLGPKLDSSFVDEIRLSKTFILIKLKDFNENYTTKLEPDFPRLKYIDRRGAEYAVIVTQKANFDSEKVHFYSRVFGPWNGVNEDPVSGLPHTQLMPYWCDQLGVDGPLIGYQSSERGGFIRCVRNGDRIELSGNAVLVFSGSILL